MRNVLLVVAAAAIAVSGYFMFTGREAVEVSAPEPVASSPSAAETAEAEAQAAAQAAEEAAATA